MSQNSPKLFVFVALECEAKALINYFELKKDNCKHPFSIYCNEQAILTVTGVGKVAMAGAVAYVLAGFPDVKMPIILNIGIAGHKVVAIGELLLASKVTDADSKKVFYPQLIGSNWPATSEILSTTLPNTCYSENCLNDMEASAFYEIATKFSSSELIHCLKVVSDNEQFSTEGINAKIVEQWLKTHIDKFEQIFTHLKQLRESILPIELEDYNTIIKQWHFTVSGKVKLKALLRRWGALSSGSWLKNQTMNFDKGKAILHKLAVDVDSLEVNL